MITALTIAGLAATAAMLLSAYNGRQRITLEIAACTVPVTGLALYLAVVAEPPMFWLVLVNFLMNWASIVAAAMLYEEIGGGWE